MGRQRGASAQEQFDYKSAVDMAKALKPLRRPLSQQPTTLTSEEQQQLAQCRAAVDTLQWAFWLAGKALESIREGKLYRADAPTFEEFVWQYWRMSKAQANKLIRTWKIAEAVFENLSNGLAPIGAKPKGSPAPGPTAEQALRQMNQAQVWELVPLAKAWGTEAAVAVYRTVIETGGPEVTAKVVKSTVDALPTHDNYEPGAVAALVREHVASLSGAETDGPDEEPTVDFTVQAQRAVSARWVQRLASRNTADAHRFLDEVQAQVDKIRAQLPPAG
ncbi:hypothetical protein [Streptomyces sp. NPDC058657]|uniref:hypothetical protein n=1 Tax=unclassified Streptomyces TaxID=2593676 RepID=UPI00366908FA